MNEDTPDDVVHTRAAARRCSPGTASAARRSASEESIDGDGPRRHRRASTATGTARPTWSWPRPATSTHAEVVDHVAGCLADVDAGAQPERRRPVDALDAARRSSHRPTEQAHVAMAWRGLHHTDPDRYALMVANQVLGGGMSSRLFQEVREERGLAYTVFSSPSYASWASSRAAP